MALRKRYRMTSDVRARASVRASGHATPSEAFVWIYLPEATEPVVAGRLFRDKGRRLSFHHGQSYLANPAAIALYLPELPLQAGAIAPRSPDLLMPACIRDASPDAWGRRVLIHRTLGAGALRAGSELDELSYLLESGSNRIGALDFQPSSSRYAARQAEGATLQDLLNAAGQVERGVPLAADIALALQHGTALGGARPKALLHDAGRQYIAKFSSSTDITNMVKAEFVAMRLAAHVGLNVAPVRLERVLDKDVLLVERFDRRRVQGSWTRRAMVSALTMLELDEMQARYASYEQLAGIIRHRFTAPKATLRELFGRLVFNILCGNTDDHARNHAAFWDGKALALTPAYDICPQPRVGGEASQAMLIQGEDRRSQLAAVIAAAPVFLVDGKDAVALVNAQIAAIGRAWRQVCREAGLAATEREVLGGRLFFNVYAFEGAPEGLDGPPVLE